MKMFPKLVAILFCSALCLLWNSCSNGSDSAPIIISSPSGGGTQTPTETPTTTPAPTPTLATYTITFNANDGSQNPATATQTFTQGTPQALKTIAELGFSKAGFNFAGWGTSSSATAASFSDGSSYTATANATLYALWSAIPVYSVNIPVNEHGTVTATPATATAGTEITLSATPNDDSEFLSYIVTAADGSAVAVTNGKFTLPAQNVTVTAAFNVIKYKIMYEGFQNGTLISSPAVAKVGTTVTLSAAPATGYVLASLTVTAADGSSVEANINDNTLTFTMPKQNVTVTASFDAIKYTVTIASGAHGIIEVNGSRTTGIESTVGKKISLFGLAYIGYTAPPYFIVTAADGSDVSVINGEFSMPAQNVTVTGAFPVDTNEKGAFKKVGTVTHNSTEYDLVTFGLWPQTIKAKSVKINEAMTEIHGAFTYCVGSDGEWYVMQREDPYPFGDCNIKYSDGTKPKSYAYAWFKVEPIKWRVISKGYTDKAFLLAEKILTAGIQYCFEKNSRTIGGNTVYYNNYKYSTIRAYLNGAYESDDTQPDTYSDKGFLQTAFSSAQQSLIRTTTVDNSASSTVDADGKLKQADACYVCENTIDKIFLLSLKEVTTYSYGFSHCDWGTGSLIYSRSLAPTDFAKATGAYGAQYGEWFLRSPGNNTALSVHSVGTSGTIDDKKGLSSNREHRGVVPALFVSN